MLASELHLFTDSWTSTKDPVPGDELLMRWKASGHCVAMLLIVDMMSLFCSSTSVAHQQKVLRVCLPLPHAPAMLLQGVSASPAAQQDTDHNPFPLADDVSGFLAQAICWRCKDMVRQGTLHKDETSGRYIHKMYKQRATARRPAVMPAAAGPARQRPQAAVRPKPGPATPAAPAQGAATGAAAPAAAAAGAAAAAAAAPQEGPSDSKSAAETAAVMAQYAAGAALHDMMAAAAPPPKAEPQPAAPAAAAACGRQAGRQSGGGAVSRQQDSGVQPQAPLAVVKQEYAAPAGRFGPQMPAPPVMPTAARGRIQDGMVIDLTLSDDE